MTTIPVHPGTIVRQKLFADQRNLSISLDRIAKSLLVHPTTLRRLMHGQHGISITMASKLAAILPDTDAAYWLRLQEEYNKHHMYSNTLTSIREKRLSDIAASTL